MEKMDQWGYIHVMLGVLHEAQWCLEIVLFIQYVHLHDYYCCTHRLPLYAPCVGNLSETLSYFCQSSVLSSAEKTTTKNTLSYQFSTNHHHFITEKVQI